MVSTHGVDSALRKYCYLYGVTAVEPEILPLPMLVRLASRPAARRYFQDRLLSEFIRLAGHAMGPLESRFVPEGRSHLRFDMGVLPDEELDDLLWLHEEFSADVLELVDVEKPGHFEERAEQVLQGLGIV